jgi:hypothetical protein
MTVGGREFISTIGILEEVLHENNLLIQSLTASLEQDRASFIISLSIAPKSEASLFIAPAENLDAVPKAFGFMAKPPPLEIEYKFTPPPPPPPAAEDASKIGVIKDGGGKAFIYYRAGEGQITIK